MRVFAQLLSSTPRMAFQLRAKNVGLTYPQCDLDKQVIFDQIRARCGDNLIALIVAIERHQDGNTHYHAYLRFHAALSTRDARYFDIEDFHPNIQALRSPRGWISYCLKEDQEVLSFGIDITKYRPGGSSERLSDIVARRLDAGDSLGQVFQDHPGFLLLNMRKALDLKAFLARESIRREKLDFGLLSPLQPGTPDNDSLAQWLNGNLRVDRPLRSPQLWLHGPPGSGKTSLVMELEKYLMVYWVPQDMDFLEGFDDNYDLICFDEMKSQKKLTWLNQFIVGSPMVVNVKGASVQKKRNVPVIFLSNSHPEVTYNKDSPQRNAFLDRLTIIELNEVRINFVPLDLNE